MKQNCTAKSISRNNLSDSDNSKPHCWICVLFSFAFISLRMRELVRVRVCVLPFGTIDWSKIFENILSRFEKHSPVSI